MMETTYVLLKQCQQCGTLSDKNRYSCTFCGLLFTKEILKPTWGQGQNYTE